MIPARAVLSFALMGGLFVPASSPARGDTMADAASGGALESSRNWPVDARWLWIPIRPGAPLQRLELRIDGTLIDWFDVELADGRPEWWAPIDLQSWRGRTLEVRGASLPKALAGFSGFQLREQWPDSGKLYRERLRPQVHFSPRRGWINDPNGLVYYRGEYHLFFQHNPVGARSANKHWGHAVSTDLVHWTELDDPLRPDEMGMMYSGSAVVDWHDTSGFGRGGVPPLVLIYTAANEPRVQCLAYSNDGRAFEKYPGNPVVANVTPLNRDPKVFWHEATHRWILALYTSPLESGPGGDEPRHTIRFYASTNLRDWETVGAFSGGLGRDRFLYECPDLFALPAPGGGERKWVLWAANGQYVIGRFDGHGFTAETAPLPGFFGRAYAGQTFNDEPSGRVIQMQFLRAPAPRMPFSQCLSVPLELSLRDTAGGLRLVSRPVPEFDRLRGNATVVSKRSIQTGENMELAVGTVPLDFEMQIRPSKACRVRLDVRGCSVTYDAGKEELASGKVRAPLSLKDGLLRLRVIVDRTTVEVFAQAGLVYMPLAFVAPDENRPISLTAERAGCEVIGGEVHQLASAWTPSDL